ncbi:MAG: 3-phosphoshikimate 1-carboxyvinyltransferase [Candidatus Acidiferrales bacterium]
MTGRTILPARAVTGTVQVPGDKSISHRYAIVAALAQGVSEIHNFSNAVDCSRTLDCLRRLGVKVRAASDRVAITGAGLDGLKRSWRALDAGNSGSTMRLLAGVLAGQAFTTKITGDDSLRRRPMRRVIDPLTQMGAQITSRDAGFAPLRIRGGKLQGIDYTLPVPSAQVKSAILLAGLFASGSTSVTEPLGTRDHTEIALAEFGADVSRAGGTIRVQGRPRLRAQMLAVPGDISSAMFFIAAALTLPGSNLMLHNVGLNPTRAAVLDFLTAMGASIRLLGVQMQHGELVGDVAVGHATLAGGVISGDATAKMIDELPMLAALAPFTEQGIEIRNAAELRVKESDRVDTLAVNLRRMGAGVEEFPDGLRISGRAAGGLRGAEINPQGDHRIAMAFAVAALGAEGQTIIRDSECAAVSFPGFFDRLEQIAER